MELILEMEEFAKLHKVPIMQEEGLAFMCSFIKEHNIKRILEIGTAIGYSALRMALLNPDIEVVSIERDLERYEQACAYIDRSPCKNQITLIYGDALETQIDGVFDLLFIDAAKGQYIRFFERYEENVVQGGYVISDNLQFHGYVKHQEREMSRNLRSLVKKIARFVEYLKQREEYDTTFLDYGDGIGISRKK